LDGPCRQRVQRDGTPKNACPAPTPTSRGKRHERHGAKGPSQIFKNPRVKTRPAQASRLRPSHRAGQRNWHRTRLNRVATCAHIRRACQALRHGKIRGSAPRKRTGGASCSSTAAAYPSGQHGARSGSKSVNCSERSLMSQTYHSFSHWIYPSLVKRRSPAARLHAVQTHCIRVRRRPLEPVATYDRGRRLLQQLVLQSCPGRRCLHWASTTSRHLVPAKVAPSKSMTNFRRSFRGFNALQRRHVPASCA